MNESEKKLLPSGIKQKLKKLHRVETELGHLPPEMWAVNELQRRVADPEFAFFASQNEQMSELLFNEICGELKESNFTETEIAAAINEVLQYPGGPAYCNAAEVAESLGTEKL